jgi:hypothetical protein
MLNGLSALNANIAHQTPAAISVSRLGSKFRRDGVHARKERRVCGCVAKICCGSNVFTRQDQQVQRCLRRDVFNGDHKIGRVTLLAR